MHSGEPLSTSLLYFNLQLFVQSTSWPEDIKYKTSVEIKIKTKGVKKTPQNLFAFLLLSTDLNKSLVFEGKSSQASGILCRHTVCCHPVI